jgi:hypothetical protein
MPIASHRGIHHRFIQSGVVITTINAIAHAMSGFLCG